MIHSESMSRRKGKAIVLACALMACLAVFCLAACGNSDPKSGFEGTWDLYETQSDDENQVMSHDTVADLQKANQQVFLNLNEDGTASYLLFTSATSGTWEAKDSTEATLSISGQSYDLSLDGDGRLRWTDGDQTRVFEKGEAKNPDDYAVKTVEKVEDKDFKPITIADDTLCKAVAKSCYSDEYGDAGYEVKVTNKSKSTIYFTPGDTFTIDGSEASLVGSVQVDPGKSETSFFYFDKDAVGGGLEKLKNVKGSFEVLDVDKYKEQKSYEFSANEQ